MWNGKYKSSIRNKAAIHNMDHEGETRDPIIGLHIFSQFRYSSIETQHPQPLSSFSPSGSQPRRTCLNQKYENINYGKIYPVLTNTTQAPRIAEGIIKDELKPYANKAYYEQHMVTKSCSNFQSFEYRNSTILPAASIPASTDANSDCVIPSSGITYLELHTRDPLKRHSKILPIKLPSPLITNWTTFNPIHHYVINPEIAISNLNHQSRQQEPNNISSSCNVEEILTYAIQGGPKLLKSCQITLKGYNGETRNSQVGFL